MPADIAVTCNPTMVFITVKYHPLVLIASKYYPIVWTAPHGSLSDMDWGNLHPQGRKKMVYLI